MRGSATTEARPSQQSAIADQDLDKLIDFDEAERSYVPSKVSGKAQKFVDKQSAKHNSSSKGPNTGFAKEIRAAVLPKIKQNVKSSLEFDPIPGPALSLFERSLEDKLLTWDRKNMSEHERIKLLTDLHFKRQRAYAKWRKKDRDPYKLWKQSLNLVGNRMQLRSDWFTFSEISIEKDNDLVERVYSLPPCYHGINSKTEYLKEYSTICYWENSKVSWALSSGFSNALSFSMTSRLTPSPRFWQAVALMSEPAKRFCGAHWFEAIVKALDSWTHYPDGVFVEPLKYPPKPLYRIHSEPGMIFEIFNGLYEIPSKKFFDYADLWGSENQLERLRFLMLCCFSLERPDLDEAQILSAIVDIQATPIVSEASGVDQYPDEVSLSDWYSANHLCSQADDGLKCICPDVYHISGNLLRVLGDPQARFKPEKFVRKLKVHQEYRFFNDGFLTSAAIDYILSQCRSESDIAKVTSILPPPDKSAIYRRRNSMFSGFSMGDLLNKLRAEHTSTLEDLTEDHKLKIVRKVQFSEHFTEIGLTLLLDRELTKEDKAEMEITHHSVPKAASSVNLGSDLFFTDFDQLEHSEIPHTALVEAIRGSDAGSSSSPVSLFQTKYDDSRVKAGKAQSYSTYAPTTSGSVEDIGDPAFNLAGVPLTEVDRVPLITLDEYTSESRFFLRRRIFERGIT
jgi:hypothetical protein